MLVTEDLVEKLTPSKEMAESDPEERIKILDGIAEVCMQQGQYHLATKKYTQAGNKVKVSNNALIGHILTLGRELGQGEDSYLIWHILYVGQQQGQVHLQCPCMIYFICLINHIRPLVCCASNFGCLRI